ncbi:MAG: membrane protein [Actinobacteria bacterium]|nr:membrane protein [Actinomycetota bacterium]
MKTAPRLLGGLAIRVVGLFCGLAVIAAGIVCTVESRLGVAPWDVLHLGVARHSPLTFGRAAIVVGLVVMVFAWLLGQPPGFGTVANALVIGSLIDLFRGMAWVGRLSQAPLPERAGLLLAGIVGFGIGSAFYIGAGLGAGPRDSLMLVLSRRTRTRIGTVRATIELSALACGIALGGTFGIGTVALALLVGPLVEACFWLICRLGLAQPGVGEQPAVVGSER